jgi:hypothetical protein
MTKWLEFNNGDQIDRYRISGLSIDEFLDLIVTPFLGQFKDIEESDYESKKSHEMEYNYMNVILVERYVLKHPSKEARNSWNRTVRSIKREKLLESFGKGELF